MRQSWKLLVAISLTLVLGACNQSPGPDGGPTNLSEIPVPAAISPEVPATPTSLSVQGLPATTSAPVITPEPGGLPLDPTRLPEPHLVQVLDWELVSVDTQPLCAGCEPDQVVLAAPRDLGIAVVRVYSRGGAGDAASVVSNLTFAEGVKCAPVRTGEFCGLIFGQIKEGVLILIAQYEAGDPHQLTYLITYQRWADYQVR